MPGNDGLSPNQAILLKGFLDLYQAPRSGTEAHFLDQSVASFRKDFTGTFGLELTNNSEYFATMAGVSIGTQRMLELIAQGYSPEIAVEVIRRSVAGLMPRDTSEQPG